MRQRNIFDNLTLYEEANNTCHEYGDESQSAVNDQVADPINERWSARDVD